MNSEWFFNPVGGWGLIGTAALALILLLTFLGLPRHRLSPRQRYALYAQWLDHADPAIRANALLCLVNQANYLLDKQIEALEAQFIEEGGYSEQLAVARLAERNRKMNHPTDRSDRPDRADQIPPCPKCGKPMVLRTAQKGKQTGKQFWGCFGYPECKGLVDV